MKRVAIVLIGVISVFILVQSCKHEVPDINTDRIYSNIPTVSDTCNWDTVYFVKEILPIIVSNCAGTECHDDKDPEGGMNFTTYVNIMLSKRIIPGNPDQSDFYEVLAKHEMPPDGRDPLTPEQINAIRIWIKQGANNNDCFNGCDSTNYTFSSAIWPILNATCKGCHSNIKPSKGIKIIDYPSVKTLVNSGIFEISVFHLEGGSPMPPKGQLDSCSMYKVRQWLNAGAPNN